MFFAVYNHGTKPASIRLVGYTQAEAEEFFNTIDHEAAKSCNDLELYHGIKGEGLKEEEYAGLLRVSNGYPFAFPDLREDYLPEHLGFVLWALP